jgi:hypothetical protein
MTEESLHHYGQLYNLPSEMPSTIPPLDPLERNSQLGHYLRFLKSLNDNEIKSCNQEPMAYIVPFLHRFQAYFSSHKH